MEKDPVRRGRLRGALLARVGALALICAAAVTLLATASSSAKSPASSSKSSSSGTAYAKAQVALYEKIPPQTVPAIPVKDIKKMKGKTVYYIPISVDVPAFAIAETALKKALSSVGAKLETCSGNFNPSQFSACMTQAINAHAGAIVTDAIAYQLISPLIKKASAKGIGVVITDVDEQAGDPKAKNIGYIPGSDEQDRIISDWITADSGGKGDALLLEATDSPTSTHATSIFAVNELKKECPGCKYQVLPFSSSNQSQLASLISSALLKNPNINYIDGEFDQYTSFIQQGLTQANATGRVKVIAADSALSGMQSVAQSSSPVKAEIADNEVYIGWMMADQAIRTITGSKVIPNYYEPVRLFTAGNIKSVKVTNGALASGSWFGSNAYQAKYKKLWSGR